MITVDIEPHTSSLLAAIEIGVRSVLGSVELQTDFRRSAKGPVDANVFVKARVDRPTGAALAAAFDASAAVESARFNKQKLSLRFTNAFIAARLARQVAEDSSCVQTKAPAKVVVGFCDPNANKALHVGHLRNVAIGGAISGLWQAIGADVTRQCVICDIGRNVAEALAGLEAAGVSLLDSTEVPLSERLGALYADFVQQTDVPTDRVAEGDAPIARELSRRDDAADLVLDRWRDGDPETHALWSKVIKRVCAEQLATLDRLGIGFERIIYESDAVDGAGSLVVQLADIGAARADTNGAYVLETGREDYAICPLTRSDGFPTEHLRALVLWNRLREDLVDIDRLVHVMGQEWRTSTEIRLDTLGLFQTTGFQDCYEILAHELVRIDGSKMKSSSGLVILLDHLFDAIKEQVRSTYPSLDPQEINPMVRVALMALMLDHPHEAEIEVSMAYFMDPERNPGLRIVEAFAGTKYAIKPEAVSPHVRFLILQGERLARMTQTAAEKSDPRLVVRFLIRLAETRLEPGATDEGDALLHLLLSRGCRALGWLP